VNEEYVSGELYRAAVRDPAVRVVSWQSTDGKGYFAADVKLRLPDRRRLEPDLILDVAGRLWLIEVKTTHLEALEDEAKLEELVDVLGAPAVLRQIEVRSGHVLAGRELVLAVAFHRDEMPEPSEPAEADAAALPCLPHIVHIDWSVLEPEVADGALGETLAILYTARQSST
jgi:hypothetical protein